MGGFASRDKFIDEDGKLKHYFEIPDFPLCGGMTPISISALQQLKKAQVGLIVTALLDPFHSGRLINHLPYDHGDTEWTDTDDDLETTSRNLNFEILHIPIQDGCPPIKEHVETLLKNVKDFLQRRPQEKIYIHCWAGGGRTSLLMILILHNLYQCSVDDAIKIVSKANNRFKLSYEFQRPYLRLEKNPMFPNISDHIFPDFVKPEIRTPKDHKCWGNTQ